MDVALFVTCLTDSFFPRAGEAVVRVLRHLGCQVHFPRGQTCCGQPAYNSGFHHEARALIRRMARVFGSYDCVVTPSASCATMVRHHGPELFPAGSAEHDRAARLARHTWEFSQFLRDVRHIDPASLLRASDPVTYHYPCHARECYSAADLERWFCGRATAPALPDLCCGFGGLFSVEYPEVSAAMARDKVAQLAATGARTVICNEAACALQIVGTAHRQGLDLRCKHLAECMAESLGLMEPAA